MEQQRAWAAKRIAALNHALRGIPPERVRHHTCYGINMGPRTSDFELKHMADLIVTINAGYYSFEMANPRHEHEWQVWETVKLPDGKVLVPGCITHASVIVEHPELVAERIVRLARVVGRERVMASADCGFASTLIPTSRRRSSRRSSGPSSRAWPPARVSRPRRCGADAVRRNAPVARSSAVFASASSSRMPLATAQAISWTSRCVISVEDNLVGAIGRRRGRRLPPSRPILRGCTSASCSLACFRRCNNVCCTAMFPAETRDFIALAAC